MRKKIVAGNWKMNLVFEEAHELVQNVIGQLEVKPPAGDVIFFPSTLYVNAVAGLCQTNQYVFAGAQNLSQFKAGAYTGEVSATQLRCAGATHVLVGHSERRAIFGEDNETLAEKVRRALEEGLVPVFCCGEQLPVREAGNHFELVKTQLETALFGLEPDDFSRVIIAYEPVWAIGTGVTASPEQAQEMHAHIRSLVAEKFGQQAAGDLTILYGGSCNPRNAAELFAMPDVDGGLIGGASLKAEDFIQIIHSF